MKRKPMRSRIQNAKTTMGGRLSYTCVLVQHIQPRMHISNSIQLYSISKTSFSPPSESLPSFRLFVLSYPLSVRDPLQKSLWVRRGNRGHLCSEQGMLACKKAQGKRILCADGQGTCASETRNMTWPSVLCTLFEQRAKLHRTARCWVFEVSGEAPLGVAGVLFPWHRV